jgi:plastocyanin
MKKLTVFLCLAVGFLLLASCGSSATTPTPSGSSTQPPTPTDMPSEQVVNIKDFRFDPDPIIIVQGASLTWTNQDAVNHQILFERGPIISMSPILKPGDSWTGTFLETGDFPYSCTLHPSMKGTVNVRLPVDIPPSHPSP